MKVPQGAQTGWGRAVHSGGEANGSGEAGARPGQVGWQLPRPRGTGQRALSGPSGLLLGVSCLWEENGWAPAILNHQSLIQRMSQNTYYVPGPVPGAGDRDE